VPRRTSCRLLLSVDSLGARRRLNRLTALLLLAIVLCVESVAFTCRVLAAISGAIFLWAALFLKEDEEGRVQRTLDIWRDRLAVWPLATKARRSAALKLCAASAAAILDRVFGRRLLSKRAVVVSAALSMGSVVLVIGAVSAPNKFSWLMFGGALVCAAAFGPSVDRRLQCLPIVAIVLCLGAWIIIGASDSDSSYYVVYVFLPAAAASGVLSDFLLITINRKILRWAATVASFNAAVLVLSLNLFLAAALLLAPYELFLTAIGGDDAWGIGAVLAKLFAASNLFTALAAALVVAIALLLVIDELFWFFAERPVYAAARYGVIQKKKTLLLVGVTLIGSASPRLAAIGRSLIEKFVQ